MIFIAVFKKKDGTHYTDTLKAKWELASKKEMEEIPDELNPDLMLNTIASELLIKIAKGEIDIQKLVRKQLSDRGIDDQRNWIGPDKARKYWEKYKMPV